jgi:hypothetical protein
LPGFYKCNEGPGLGTILFGRVGFCQYSVIEEFQELGPVCINKMKSSLDARLYGLVFQAVLDKILKKTTERLGCESE